MREGVEVHSTATTATSADTTAHAANTVQAPVTVAGWRGSRVKGSWPYAMSASRDQALTGSACLTAAVQA
jgi:hypothetical protein